MSEEQRRLGMLEKMSAIRASSKCKLCGLVAETIGEALSHLNTHPEYVAEMNRVQQQIGRGSVESAMAIVEDIDSSLSDEKGNDQKLDELDNVAKRIVLGEYEG